MSIDATTGSFDFTGIDTAMRINSDGIIISTDATAIDTIQTSGVSLQTNTALGTRLMKDSLAISMEKNNNIRSLSYDWNGLILH
jgi:hypothetical protein